MFPPSMTLVLGLVAVVAGEPLSTILPDTALTNTTGPAQQTVEGVLEHSVIYQSLPPQPDYKSDAGFDPRGMEHVYLLVNTFLDLIQRDNVLPASINTELLSKTVAGGGPELLSFLQTHWQDILLQYIGLLTAAVLGLLLALVFPVVGFFFCCCRCAGKCGAYPETPYDKRSDACKRVSTGVVLSFFVIAALFGCVCAFVTNQYQYEGWDQLSDSVDTSLDDTGMYFEHTKASVETLLVTNYEELEEVLATVLDESGPILKTNLARVTHAIAIDNLTSIVAGLQDVKRDLKGIKKDAQDLSKWVQELRQGLIRSQNQLKNATGMCKDNTACASFLQQYNLDEDLQLAHSFSVKDAFKIPDITTILEDIDKLIENDIEEKVEVGKRQLDNVEQEIEDSIDDIKPKVKEEIRKMGKELKNQYDNIHAALDEMDVANLQKEELRQIQEYQEYILYRYYIGLGMSALVTLVLVCFVLGLFYGMCGKRPGGLYGDECCNKGTGANFLLSGIYLTFLFSFVLLILTTAHFLVGAAMEKVICETMTSPAQSDLFLELDHLYLQPKLKQFMNNNNNNMDAVDKKEKDYSAAGLITGCHNNDTIYNILQLESVYNISQFVNWRKNYGIGAYIENLKNKIQLRQLKDITLLTPATKQHLEELAQSRISDMNFTRYTELLEDEITKIDLKRFTMKIRSLKESVKGFDGNIAADLELEAKWLDMINGMVANMTVTARRLKSRVVQLEENSKFNHSSMRDAVKSLISQADRATEFLQKKGPELISNLTETYVADMVGLIDEYVERVIDKTKHEVGYCAPLSTSYNATVVAFCNEFVDPFNGFWASVGWCVLLYLPCVALSVSLISLYRKSESYPGPLVESQPLEDRSHSDARGAAPKKGRAKGHRRNPSGYLPEYTHSRPQQGHAYTDMRYDGGRFRDIAPRNWDGESSQPPRYTSNPSLAQPAPGSSSGAAGEYERPPPYYYPGPAEGAK